MKIVKKTNLNDGFTLMEMIIVIGIAGMLVAMSLFIDINGYRGDAFRSEENSFGISLQAARADALNNINQKKHGVAINPDGYEGYVIFEGDSYSARDTTRDENIEAIYKAIFPATPTEIVFDQLSGNANFDGDIVMTDPERNMTAIISINHEGRISW